VSDSLDLGLAVATSGKKLALGIVPPPKDPFVPQACHPSSIDHLSPVTGATVAALLGTFSGAATGILSILLTARLEGSLFVENEIGTDPTDSPTSSLNCSQIVIGLFLDAIAWWMVLIAESFADL
jgi:hypothetical protein